MKPTVFIFSEPQALALNIIENLLANLCRVRVIASDLKNWRLRTKHLSKNDNLEFLNKRNFSKADKSEYLLYLDLYPEDLRALVKKVEQIAKASQSKGFLITSLKSRLTDRKLLAGGGRVGIVYVSDLYGPRMEFDGRSRTAEIIRAALLKKKAKVFKGEKIYPVLLARVAKLISKWLFSFGPIGEETFLSNEGIGAEEFCQLIRNCQPDFNYSVLTKPSEDEGSEVIITPGPDDNYLKHLQETFDFYRLTPPFLKRKKKVNKNIFYILAGVFLILTSPLLAMFAALAFLFLAKNTLLAGNLALSRQMLAASSVLVSASGQSTSLLGRIPLVGQPYQDLTSFAYVAGNICLVGQKAIEVLQNTKKLTDQIFGQGGYSASFYSEEIFSDLDYIEKAIAFSESEAKLYPGIFKNLDLALIKSQVRELKRLASVLPELLGEKGKKTYLVLFQNNMELRPGGGFIGSFALASVEAGRLVDMTVTDVYSADGQLRGHVEPPTALKKYLNQANWFLRDSNWDVDFTKSAQKAEWFLDKEMDVAVDGVVAIDLGLAKDLLTVTGPVYLGDYQAEITPENLYEKTQAEAEENFFPGSVQKAGFLTALARAILTKITEGSISNFPQLGRVLYQNLNERHLQLFLHDTVAAASLANLGWSGEFSPGQVGVVEANVGVNKANYFIQRQYFLTVSGESWHLKIIYENKASPVLGNRGVYKNYFRLVTPNTATGVTTVPYTLDVSEIAGREENGFYFEVLPGEKKEINLFWQQPVEEVISWRKQPGTEGDTASLTVDGKVVYNSSFNKDIVWIKTL